MLAISSGSLEAEAGLHFQLPPTIGRRDIIRRAAVNEERRSAGWRSMSSGHLVSISDEMNRGLPYFCRYELRRVNEIACLLRIEELTMSGPRGGGRDVAEMGWGEATATHSCPP